MRTRGRAVKLLRLELENFLCYCGIQSVDLTPAPGKPVIVIHGDNGFGKTSLSHAIDWGLYGKRRRQGWDAHSLFNWTAKKEGKSTCAVRITFEDAGQVYELARWYERTDPSKESFGGELFSCTPRGQPALSDEAYEKLISRIFPYEVSPLFLFDGEELRNIEKLVENEKDTQARDLRDRLEMVLGVPGLQRARSVAGTARDRMDTDYQALVHAEADNQQLRNELTEVEGEISDAEGLLEKHRAEKETNEQDLAKVRAELTGLEAAEAIVREQLAASATLQDVGIKLSEGLGRRCEASTPLYLEILRPRLQEVVDNFADRAKAARGGESDSLRLAGQQDLLNEIVRDKRCVCRSSLDDGRQQYVEARLRSVSDSLTRIPGAAKQPVAWDWIAEQVENRLVPDYWSLYQDAEAGVGRLLVEKSDLTGRIASLQKGLQESEHLTIRRLADQQASHAQSIGRLETDIKALEARLELARAEKRSIDGRILKGAATTNRARVERDRVAVATEGADTLEAAIEELRQIKRHDVEQAASQAFLAMRWKEDFAGLRIQKGYGLIIHLADGEDIPARSAGESQIVALSLLAGLNHCAEIRAPVIMDTLFGRLDRKHRERVLRHLSKIGEQVILLVTSGELDEEDLDPIRNEVANDVQIRFVSYGRSELQAEA
jgi:DNA sulfur modification protein DndD